MNLAKATWRQAFAGLLALGSASVWAEPTTDAPVHIGSLRPYAGGNAVFVYATTPLCPGTMYSIDLSTPSGKAVFAVALAAVTTGRAVRIEIANAPCGTGPAGSTIIQSLYLSA